MTDKRDGLMNILKGNQAELRVAAWLSQRCYVRPVSGGTDTGIDLYCENLDLDLAEPFLHFWVQVKCGKQVSVSAAGASFRFMCKDIRYWMRQPVPVFAFLIPEAGDSIYVTDFTRQLFRGTISTKGPRSTVLLNTDLRLDLRTNSVSDFIEAVVKPDYVLRAAQLGVHAYVPQLNPSYIRQGMGGIYGPYTPRVIDQIRRAASAALRDLVAVENLDEQQVRLMSVLAAVLSPFTKARNSRDVRKQDYQEWHYGDYVAVGMWLHRRSMVSEGNDMLQRALRCIESDRKFKAAPGTASLVESIKSRIQTLPETPDDHVQA